ncbi:MAG: GNAT family N-acetyltransferase [Thermoguttaceae bacterium]
MSGPAPGGCLARHGCSAAVDIRRMASHELSLAIDWAAEEGWNPGIHDAETFYRADPQGFFLALHEGKPVGCCSAVVYDRVFAFFGLFIVHPDYRGRGIGLALTGAAMDHVGGCNCGLDGVVAMQSRYARFGFQPAYRNIRFQGNVAGRLQDNVVPVDQGLFDEIEDYDRRHFCARRRAFLQHWLVQPGASAWACVEDGRVAGYGVLRPCRSGCKIGPLFADNDRIADALCRSLCSRSGGAPVFLDVPEPNQAALALARSYGMQPCFETARMYTRGTPPIPVQQVYGVTTFELG